MPKDIPPWHGYRNQNNAYKTVNESLLSGRVQFSTEPRGKREDDNPYDLPSEFEQKHGKHLYGVAEPQKCYQCQGAQHAPDNASHMRDVISRQEYSGPDSDAEAYCDE